MRGFRSALIIAAMVGCGGTQENANQADPGTIAGTMRDPAPAAYSQVGGSIIPLYSWPTDANGNVVATLRAINVTIQYNTPRTRIPKNYVLTSFISQFR